MNGSVSQSIHHSGPDSNISTTIGWIEIKICADIHAFKKLNVNFWGDLCINPSVLRFLHLAEVEMLVYR